MTESAACASDVRLAAPHSTGKERDSESGNDYFGARYYASTMGRFLSPDWASRVEPVPYAKLDNPQSLNLYSYVWNNPLSRNDPDGHEVDLTNKDAKLRAETEKRILSNVNENERGLFTTSTDKNGKTSLVLKKDANFEGKHSAGFNKLTKAIASRSIASVEINDHPTLSDGRTINTAYDAGGGRTEPTGQGRNVNIYLSTEGDQSGVALYGYARGSNGYDFSRLVPIENPVGIIAGHELLGHGLLGFQGKPSGEGAAIDVENQLRVEQGLSIRGGW
jgi:RHS repeat-associated protein